MDEKTYLLPAAYLAPIEYYTYLVNEHCLIEQHSHYAKQTYANRCNIATANGIESLSIPIIKPQDKCPLCDIRISSHNNWRQIHWRAISSAYSSSPFFEYYQDDLAPFFEKKFEFLLDFNIQIQDKILDLLDYKDVNYQLTDNYINCPKINIIDMRELMHPKKNSVSLHNDSANLYYQVFDHKLGFIPNLSIVDLLFNMGNESRIYLKR